MAKPAPKSSAIRSQLELDKLKYDLFVGIPKQNIVTMTNSGGGEVFEGVVDPSTKKRHGKGTLKWPNGNVYFGDWKDSSMSGKGTFFYAVENDVYRGEFRDDKKHGTGRYEFANGNFYEGQFAIDKRHGTGKYSWTCGDSYEGEWRDGHMEGKGTTIYSNKNRYDGEFHADRREGNGTLVCADGLSYSGQWLKNMRHGNGKLQFPNGDFYEGQWEGDKKHGRGIDQFINGNRFEGQYRDNVKHGHGVMTYSNQDQYSGEWKGDKMEGQGVYRFSNGFIYDGSWIADVRHGKGTYTFPTGHVYVGEWRADKRHGAGVLTIAPQGDVYKGSWVDGKMHGLFTVERHQDYREDRLPPPSATPAALPKGSPPLFTGPLQKLYEGHWENGVPSRQGQYFVYDPKSTSPPLSLTGVWDLSKSDKKSDGTIESIPQRVWDALAFVTGSIAAADSTTNAGIAAFTDRLFLTEGNDPRSAVSNFYDAELLSYLPTAADSARYSTLMKQLAPELASLEDALREETNRGSTAPGGDAEQMEREHRKEIEAADQAMETMNATLADLDTREQTARTAIAKAAEALSALKQETDRETKERQSAATLASQIQKLQAQQKELTDTTRQLEQSIHNLKNEKIPAAQMELGNAREGVDGVLTTNKASATQGLQDAKRTLENKEQECKVASKLANDLAAKNRDTQKSQDALRAKLDAQIAVLVKQCSDAEKAQQKKVQSSEQQQRKVAQQVETTWNQLREELETVRSRQSATESLLQSLQEQLPREHEASKEAESTEKSLASEINTAQRMLSSDQTALALLEEETADLRQELLQLQSVTEARTQAETVRAQESQAAFAKCLAAARAANETEKQRTAELLKRRSELERDVSALKESAQPVAQGRLRRKSAVALNMLREEEGVSTSSASTALQSAIDERVRENDELEVLVERRLREKKSLEDEIKKLQLKAEAEGEGSHASPTKSKTRKGSAVAEDEATMGPPPPPLAPSASLDLSEAGREAVRHQLIKTRSKQTNLLREQEKLRMQLQQLQDALRDWRSQDQDGAQANIAAILASLRPEDWRLAYLAEQIETKGKMITELEGQVRMVPLLEAQLAAHKEAIANHERNSAGGSGLVGQSGGSGVFSSSARRPAPF